MLNKKQSSLNKQFHDMEDIGVKYKLNSKGGKLKTITVERTKQFKIFLGLSLAHLGFKFTKHYNVKNFSYWRCSQREQSK